VIGISGAQGCGKSTLSKGLVERLSEKGTRSIAVSIDDFYLTHQEQQALSKSSQNPLLQQRGYPGTHDLELAMHCMRGLREGREVRLPRYDKSAFDGLGDRATPETWEYINQPLDIVIFEGWFLGFQVQQTDDPDFQEINHQLQRYTELFALCDELVYLRPIRIEDIIHWRIEAEKNMRAEGKSGLSDQAVAAYIKKFIPAYQLYRDTVTASLVGAVYSNRTIVF